MEAVASLPPTTACVAIVCAAGHYALSAALVLPPGVSVVGAGINSTVLHKIGTSRLGSMQARSSLRDVTILASGGDGFQVHGPDCAACRVALSDVFLNGFRLANEALFFSLVDSSLTDVYYGLWAEATCGYAGHLIQGNTVRLTRPAQKPGQGMAFNWDNGNSDGIVCTDPPQSQKHNLTNIVEGNHIHSFAQFGIAVARMHGFIVRNNIVLHGTNSGTGWGNAIHFEHECRDVLIEGNTAAHPVGGSISVTGSSNVTITGNSVQMSLAKPKPSEACIIADNNRNPVVVASGLRIHNNTVSGCNVGIDVWGNSSAVTFHHVSIVGNSISNTTRAGIQLGASRWSSIDSNTMEGTGGFVNLLAFNSTLSVVPPFTLEGNNGSEVGDCSINNPPRGSSVTVQGNLCRLKTDDAWDALGPAAQKQVSAPRFPVVWHVGSGYNSVNGSIPAPGWPASLAKGWQCDHPGSFFPSVNVTAQFGVRNCTTIQCGPGCTNPPNCEDWQMGLFPKIQDSVPVNGGVPQAANLSAHIEKLRETVVQWIPNPEWDGLAVFDFEEWTNIWELMVSPSPGGGWHSIVYQNYSIELERKAHPSWTESQLVVAAKSSYEAAATEFLVQTLRTCRALRPNAKWGLYGYPIGGEYDVGNKSSVMVQYAERQLPIFAESGALFPSIYLPSGTHGKVFPWQDSAYYQTYVRSIVQQTALLSRQVEAVAAAGGRPRPSVFPFAWSKYHNGTTLLTTEDATTEFVLPYSAGADGLVWWGGNEAGHPNDTAAFWAHTETIVGPMVKKLTAAAEECALQHCGGRGRCVSLEAGAEAGGGCICDGGAEDCAPPV